MIPSALLKHAVIRGVNGGRNVGVVFYKSDAQKGLKRGPRGDIVPKIHPDLAAKDSLKGNCYGEIIQRAMMNRVNQKKQTRDAPLKNLASRHSIWRVPTC
jgi:hypothetical protein